MQSSVRTKERTLEEYAGLLYKSRWATISIFAVIVGSSMIFSFLAAPVYEARSVVMIEPRVAKQGLGSILDVSSYIQPGSFNVSVINNQVEILRSYSLAERTLEHLRQVYGTKKLSLFRSEGTTLSQSVLVRRLQDRTTIVPLREADIIEVRGRAGGPWEAAAIANAVADTYIDTDLSTARGEVREVKTFLQEQISMVRTRLARAEEELRAYQQKEKVASLPDEITMLVDKLAYFEGLYNEATVDMESTRKRLAALGEQLTEQRSNLVEQVAQVSSPVTAQLRSETATLEGIRSKYIAQGYSESHEKMVEIERRIEETRRRLLQTAKDVAARKLSAADPVAFSQSLVDRILGLQVDVETMGSRRNSLKAVADTYEAQLQQLPDKSLQLARLERAAKVDEKVLMMLMEKYEEIRIREAGEMGSVRIIDRAREPDVPVRPRKRLNVIVGVVLGALMSLGFVFVRDRFDRTIMDVEDVEALPEIPVLGWIPATKNRRRVKGKGRISHGTRTLKDPLKEAEMRLLTHMVPHSPVSESYRTLRTNIRFLGVDEAVKTIVVSSPGPSEGKSTTVANLAISLAQGGAKTILVDSDLRRPTVDAIFGIQKGYGLTEILTDTRSVEECVASTDVANLSVIGSGTLPPNPSEMLGSSKMVSVVSQLRDSYDYVLFDSPPVLVVTDAAVLSAVADLTILVLRSGRTRWTSLVRAVTLLQNVRARKVGTMLNAVEMQGFYGRYHDYYGYYRHHPPKS
ncbi:MAG: polysaccharide biosynthesis tyrosine autokinase [Candidatus Eisenbacteria bacterium]